MVRQLRRDGGVTAACPCPVGAAAYAFSRFRFTGRRIGLLGMLLIQMFPQFLAIVAIYLMFATVTDYWPPSASTAAGACCWSTWAGR